MANTTNYNWETPDDTDLVKDGAAAIRTLGSSADTTLKNLNPQTTTGALAYRSATANVNTALPLGTAGQVLRVNSGATAPEWATTADQTPLTTKGDLFGFDSADARIPVGANDTVLTADSTQSLGVKWAAVSGGGYTTLASGSLSGSSLDLTVISQAYENLILFLRNFYPVADNNFSYKFNNSTAGIYGVTELTESNNLPLSLTYCTPQGSQTDARDADNIFMLTIFDYANTVSNKMAESRYLNGNAGGTTFDGNVRFVYVKSTDAIDRITITWDSSTFAAGTYELFGVK